MLKSLLLSAISVLIFADGLTTQSLDRTEPSWRNGSYFGMRSAPLVEAIPYEQETGALHFLLTGGKSEATVADYYRLQYGYNSRIYALATDSVIAHTLGTHCADYVLTATTVDSLYQMLSVRLRKDHVGEDGTHDVVLISLSTLGEHSTSDIITSRADERAYDTFAEQVKRMTQLFGNRKVEYHIFGMPHFGLGIDWLERLKLPNSKVDTQQVKALTNAYLMAIYGPGQWVQEVTSNRLRLGPDLIDSENVSIPDITSRVAAFLVRFSGIDEARSSEGNPIEIIFTTPSVFLPTPFVTYPHISYPADANQYPLLND